MLVLGIINWCFCCQHDKADWCGMWDLYGTVTCQADLEGAIPDVSLTLTHAEGTPTLALDHLIYHPFVQRAEAQGHFTSGKAAASWLLCTGQCESPGSPPPVDRPRGFWHWKFLLLKFPPSFAPHLHQEVGMFVLNIITAPGSEHHCHNPLGGMSESCQNPQAT